MHTVSYSLHITCMIQCVCMYVWFLYILLALYVFVRVCVNVFIYAYVLNDIFRYNLSYCIHILYKDCYYIKCILILFDLNEL